MLSSVGFMNDLATVRVNGSVAKRGADEFICAVFKMRVQHLLSGAALEMFLSCCLSLLLS